MAVIVINAVGAKMGGALRHLSNFLAALDGIAVDDRYIVYLAQGVNLGFAGQNVEIRYPKGPLDSPGKRIYFDQVVVPRICREANASALLSVLNFGTLKPPCPQVVFERNALYFWDGFWTGIPLRRRPLEYLRKWLIRMSMRSAKIVVCPSEAMKADILRSHPDIGAGKIRVIPHGFEKDDFLSANSAMTTESEAALMQFTSRREVKLLFVGHPAYYKGSDILFDSLSILKSKDVGFSLYMPIETGANVNAGRRVAGYDEAAFRFRQGALDAGLQENVVFGGWIPENAMNRVYKAADIFIFPSLCESFGFPMLEAMAAGLPVIAADTPVNREILGGTAVYYPPRSPEELAKKIMETSSNLEFRKKLAAASLKRATEYPWNWVRYATEISNIIKGCDLQ